MDRCADQVKDAQSCFERLAPRGRFLPEIQIRGFLLYDYSRLTTTYKIAVLGPKSLTVSIESAKFTFERPK